VPDPKGDSATHLAFNLPRRPDEGLPEGPAAEGIGTTCFKDNFWHYVPNWEHFLAKSTAQTKSPFTDPRTARLFYSRKAIPNAEDLLGRTLIMGINVKMPATQDEADQEGDRESWQRPVGVEGTEIMIVVTGGAGFIGSAFVAKAQRRRDPTISSSSTRWDDRKVAEPR